MRKIRFEEDECLVITMFEEKTLEKAVQTIKGAKKQMDSKGRVSRLPMPSIS